MKNALVTKPIFRKIAARANSLAPDQPDIMYAVKEFCRHMARPTVGAWKKLKRLARSLCANTRTLMQYPWQGTEDELEGFTDSDWAGCRRTGKSTSGGLVMIGQHFIT